MKDNELYKVNVNKKGLLQKRKKLAADRFKERQKPKSKYEEEKIK